MWHGLWIIPMFLPGGIQVGLPQELTVQARSAIVIDAKTGVPLWEKQADLKSYPASTTKILTTLLALEEILPEQSLVADAQCEKIEASSLFLKPGERISGQDAAYAMMLRSANDVCYLVAKHLSGSVEQFGKKMNTRLMLLGCRSTNFTSPNGLHRDDHYTTARDMSKIAAEALKNPDFRDIAKQRRAVINRSMNPKDTLLVSKNSFLDEDQTYTGVKTGYTKKAGNCFVGSAMRNGTELITVVFNSPDWRADQRLLMDFSFANLESVRVADPGVTIAKVPVEGGTTSEIEATVQEPIDRPVVRGFQPKIYGKWTETPNLKAPIAEGEVVGEWLFSDGKGWTIKVPLVAKTGSAAMARIGGSVNWITATATGLGAGVFMWLRTKTKRWATEVST